MDVRRYLGQVLGQDRAVDFVSFPNLATADFAETGWPMTLRVLSGNSYPSVGALPLVPPRPKSLRFNMQYRPRPSRGFVPAQLVHLREHTCR